MLFCLTKLCARVAKRNPNLGNDDMRIIFSAAKGVREGKRQTYCETWHPPKESTNRTPISMTNRFWFWGKILWMLHIGRARHPGPGRHPNGSMSIECTNVGGWLSNGDLALECEETFSAVIEHRLIPARVRTVTAALKASGRASVWAPACQDNISGGHAVVGVVSLRGAPLTLPSFCTPGFLEFFHMGRALRVILPLASGRIAHLFVLYGYQGASEDPNKLALTNKLLEAVICEARVCGSGQPVIFAGDLNVQPGLIPVVAKAFGCGRLVDLEAAFAHGKGPAVTCKFDLDNPNGTRRDFFFTCPHALAAAVDCKVLAERWFRPHFSVVARFRYGVWSEEVRFPRMVSPLAPACWLEVPDRSRSSSFAAVQDIWDPALCSC